MAQSRDKYLMQAVFFLNALGLGIWFPRIPDLKEALSLDIFTLALCLTSLSISTIVGFIIQPARVQRIGLKRTCMWAGAGMPLLFILPALVSGPLGLVLSFLILGQSIAMIETAMNAKVNDIEQNSGPRPIKIMSQCHAFWSFGAMAGALLGGAAAQAEVSIAQQQIVLESLIAAAAFLVARALSEDRPSDQDEAVSTKISFPTGTLLLLCFLPIGALIIEGAFLDWSVLYARDELGAAPFAAATTLSIFTLSMGFMRLFADHLSARFQPVPVIRASAIVMVIGLLGFSTAPSVAIALPFAALSGLGCASLYPLTMSLAANKAGRSSTQNVATISLFGFGAFLVGPPVLGFIGSQSSLALAFACLVPVAAYPFLLAGAAAKE